MKPPDPQKNPETVFWNRMSRLTASACISCASSPEEAEFWRAQAGGDADADAPASVVYEDDIREPPPGSDVVDPGPLEEREEEKLAGGAIYKGQWAGPMLHGKGVLRQTDGSWYDGNFFLGRKHGQGLFQDGSGNRYDGEWAKDQAHGSGNRYDGEWAKDQ